MLIVPVMLDADRQPDYRYMDAAVASIAPGVHAGSTVIFETTLPIGDTRHRFAPALERASGLVAERDLFVAFSPERLFSGAVLANLAAYPKLVGGVGAGVHGPRRAFYASVLDAEVVAMSSSEAAEFSKLADTTYRDVNIALANEFARAADAHRHRRPGGHRGGQQPALQPHPPAGDRRRRPLHPGLPAPPARRAPRAALVETARAVNDGQTGRAIEALGASWAASRTSPSSCWASPTARASRSSPTVARSR